MKNPALILPDALRALHALGRSVEAALIIHIALANVWNRLNTTVRQAPDAPWE
jgi:hypothetical protein